MCKRSLRLYGFRNARASATAGDGIEKKRNCTNIYAPEVSSLMIRCTVYNPESGRFFYFIYYI